MAANGGTHGGRCYRCRWRVADPTTGRCEACTKDAEAVQRLLASTEDPPPPAPRREHPEVVIDGVVYERVWP